MPQIQERQEKHYEQARTRTKKSTHLHLGIRRFDWRGMAANKRIPTKILIWGKTKIGKPFKQKKSPQNPVLNFFWTNLRFTTSQLRTIHG